MTTSTERIRNVEVIKEIPVEMVREVPLMTYKEIIREVPHKETIEVSGHGKRGSGRVIFFRRESVPCLKYEESGMSQV